jgi:hypothetical protein
MKLEQAKALKAALDAAIAKAEAAGSADVDFRATLSAQLGDALNDLESAIAEARAR